MIGYSISSHVMYAPLTLPVLLPSMYEAGIESSDIHVWICGAKRESKLVTKLGQLYYVTHESRGMAALIEAARNYYQWWFVMNDTMKVGPSFKELSQKIDESQQAIAASTLGKYGFPDRCQTELGAYRWDFLQSNLNWLIQFIDCDEEMNRAHEGELYSRATLRGIYGAGIYTRSEKSDIYGTGTLRTSEYYPALDMIKYKANYDDVKGILQP